MILKFRNIIEYIMKFWFYIKVICFSLITYLIIRIYILKYINKSLLVCDVNNSVNWQMKMDIEDDLYSFVYIKKYDKQFW